MRWYGFNLCEVWLEDGDERWPHFTPGGLGSFDERHFRWIAEWGFNFVRIPMCYLRWTGPADPTRLREAGLAPVDQAVAWGRKCGLHVSLNLHHAPGFCVNPPRQPEPWSLWSDEDAQNAFVGQWAHFARHYRDIRPECLSFNLLNEPKAADRQAHEGVVRRAVAAIRAADVGRPIIVDGLDMRPCRELCDLGLIQSCRGYHPVEVSHHRAWWADDPRRPAVWPPPGQDGGAWMETLYAPWVQLQRQGVAVHCGECGAHNRTPHQVFLRWMADLLAVLGRHGIGWALWNFRGSFGVLDSARQDVAYGDWHGHALDRTLLDLLRAHTRPR
jgi:endoglucanase